MSTVDAAESTADLVTTVRAGNQTWSQLCLEERAALCRAVAAAAVDGGRPWVDAAARAKHLPTDSGLLGEEWLSGPYAVATAASSLAETLDLLAEGRSPVERHQITRAPDGRTSVRVFPQTWWERLLLHGYRADVWMLPGVKADDIVDNAGLAQLAPHDPKGVSLVLGAGNVTSIGVLDTLYEVVAHNRGVILKLNPVLNEMLDAARTTLKPLIDLGAVEVVTGGIEVGQRLLTDPGIDHVHITGSQTSHDAIVFGSGAEGQARRAANDPILGKPITSELGGVSPTIVVPTGWSRRDIRFHAAHIATQRLHNGGYNCIATQVVLIPHDWDERGIFLDELRRALAQAPPRPAYYPGSDDRVSSARAAHDRHEDINGGRVLIVLDETEAVDAEALCTEYFAPVLCVVTLSGSGHHYLENASRFANERLAGTLGANVLVHPRTIRHLGARFDTFISNLRYGTIAVNAWVALGYLTARAPWGAAPGSTVDDVGSGIGVVHNASLLDDTDRTVVHGPFRPIHRALATGQFTLSPSPPWFVTSRAGAKTSELLVEFVGHPTVRKLPRLLASAMKG